MGIYTSKITKNQTQKGNVEGSKTEATHSIQGPSVELTVDFSSDTMQAKRQCNSIF
jgi:hypothetical protein